MFCHRLIRIALQLLCLACVTVWASSHFWEAYLCYLTIDRDRLIRIACGRIEIGSYQVGNGLDGVWDFATGPVNRELRESSYEAADYHFGGFALDPGVSWEIMIPLWLPTLLCLFLLWINVR